MNTKLVVEGLTTGQTYRFRFRAHNMHGWGELSADLVIVSSGVPAKPLAASVTIVNLNVLVEWTAPFDNYGQITKYKTAFALHSSTETFVEETEHCD